MGRNHFAECRLRSAELSVGFCIATRPRQRKGVLKGVEKVLFLWADKRGTPSSKLPLRTVLLGAGFIGAPTPRVHPVCEKKNREDGREPEGR
jgi:hypothetical protein